MTRTCMENALLSEAIAGVDGLDDRQRAAPPFKDLVPKYSQILLENKDAGIQGTQIGILKKTFLPTSRTLKLGLNLMRRRM